MPSGAAGQLTLTHAPMSRVTSSTAPRCACPTTGLATLGPFLTSAVGTLTVSDMLVAGAGPCAAAGDDTKTTMRATTKEARRFTGRPPVAFTNLWSQLLIRQSAGA